jgi:soluble lytic murein transglycosylase-like protein
MIRPVLLLASCLGLLLGGAGAASAELVHLSNGRVLSVRSHRVEGTSIVLQLRSGGEVVVGQDLVARITPDEVMRPDPELDRVLAEAAATEVPYREIIDRVAADHGVDPRLVRAVIQVESAWQPGARSPKGAMGLMQLMPGTARMLSVANPYDPTSNIEAGVRHLKGLLARFDVSLALAAYNAGEAAVERYGGIPPYGETRRYVAAVLRLAGFVAPGR